jgi:hypothetical protein
VEEEEDKRSRKYIMVKKEASLNVENEREKGLNKHVKRIKRHAK